MGTHRGEVKLDPAKLAAAPDAEQSIGRLRDAARKQGGISPKAEKMASDLETKQRKERLKNCTPLEDKAERDRRSTLEAIGHRCDSIGHGRRVGEASSDRGALRVGDQLR